MIDVITKQTKHGAVVRKTKGNGKAVVVIPHGGCLVPEEYFAHLNITESFKRDYDEYAIDIFEALDPSNISYIVLSDIHRDFVDFNRSPHDEFEKGVLRAVDFQRKPVLKRAYSPEERRKIITAIYNPFHNCLEDCIEEVKEQQGKVFLLAGHTMDSVGPKTAPDPGRQRPDLSIGTLDDTLAAMEYIVPFEEAIRDMAKQVGLTVAKNTPYSGGGYITKKYGRPEYSYHTIQLEVNKDTCADIGKRKAIKKIIDKVLSELPL